MINILRQNQRTLMAVVAGLTIISFIAFYSPLKKGAPGSNGVVGQIYGRDLTQPDVELLQKYYRIALMLGQYDLYKTLTASARSDQEAFISFLINLTVLRHEAEALGVNPTGDQVVARIQSLPPFQTNGQYDPLKYKLFLSEQLGPHGLVEDNILETIKDSLRLESLKAIVGSPAAATPGDLKEGARIFQKVDVQTVSFPLSATEAAVTVSEDEIKGFYNKNSAQMLAPETRSVKYVEFALPADQKLEGKEKVEALQKLANAASAFAQQAATSSFDKAAAAAGLTVQGTGEFSQNGAPKEKTDDAKSAALFKGFAPAAFLLSEQKPTSDVQQVEDAFYVVKLDKVTPLHALTFDEVRPMIEQNIRATKARQALMANANAALSKIRASLKAGQSFADAAAAVGLKPETINGLDFTDEALKPEQQQLAQTTVLMEPGQISNVLPDANGGVAVYLAARAPLDEAKFNAMKADMTSHLLENKQEILFASWLAAAVQAAKVSFAQR